MALCNPCCNTANGANSEIGWRWRVLRILCSIFNSGSSIANSANFVRGQTEAMTNDESDHEVIAAPGAGKRLVITSLAGTNGSEDSVPTYIVVYDGDTEIKRFYASDAGGGFQQDYPTPIVLSENTALNAGNITTGSETYVSAEGYIETIA